MIRWYFIGIVHKIRSILNKFNSYDCLKVFLFYTFDRNLKFALIERYIILIGIVLKLFIDSLSIFLIVLFKPKNHQFTQFVVFLFTFISMWTIVILFCMQRILRADVTGTNVTVVDFDKCIKSHTELTHSQ